jgi:hydroxyacylglutathione hydrolase
MTEGQPSKPANILNIVAINQGKKPLTMDTPVSEPLTPARVKECLAEGHIVIDGRSPGPFGAGHIPGAFSIQVRSPEFEQRVGWVAPLDPPIILVLDKDADAEMAMSKLAFIGLDSRVTGHLQGGMHAWKDAGFESAVLHQIDVLELDRRIKDNPDTQVLDVRAIEEWDSGHIDGAGNMNYRVLREQLDALDLDPNKPLSVICAGGGRSSTACSVLMQNGYKDVANITGGMMSWSREKLPKVK